MGRMLILFLDDLQLRHNLFARMMRQKHEVLQVYTAQEAREAMRDRRFDLVFLDHDLDQHRGNHSMYGWETGDDVVRYMIRHLPEDHWPDNTIIHSANEDRAHAMLCSLHSKGMNAEVMEFGKDLFNEFLAGLAGLKPAISA